MADSFIALDEPAVTDKKLDTEELTVGANTVQRERMQIAGAAAADIAGVTAANGLDVDVTRLPALVAGTANIGDVDVATLPSVSSGTLANVNDIASSTTLVASNASRKGCIIFNDSTVALYVKYGATASTTSFTVKIPPGGYWEMPTPIYTGVIDGIWASDASGAARVTEL